MAAEGKKRGLMARGEDVIKPQRMSLAQDESFDYGCKSSCPGRKAISTTASRRVTRGSIVNEWTPG